MKTPMSSDTKLTKDEECESVDSTKYHGMIGSLLYLTADSTGYVPESDPEEEPKEDNEDPEEDPADYPADREDDEDEEEEEEHPASADSVPPVHRMTARISIRDEPSISLPP
ncbi:hypothetical protein Tco_0283522, partial [Tanacetum coccineum]